MKVVIFVALIMAICPCHQVSSFIFPIGRLIGTSVGLIQKKVNLLTSALFPNQQYNPYQQQRYSQGPYYQNTYRQPYYQNTYRQPYQPYYQNTYQYPYQNYGQYPGYYGRDYYSGYQDSYSGSSSGFDGDNGGPGFIPSGDNGFVPSGGGGEDYSARDAINTQNAIDTGNNNDVHVDSPHVDPPSVPDVPHND